MKKLAIALAILILSASCSKESSTSIVGTKWETTGFSLINSLVGWKYHIYEFTDKKNVDSYWLDRNGKVASFEGTFRYTVEEPYITIEHSEDDIRIFEMTNKMTFISTTNNSIKYFKQQ